jgi:hypothetical protein
MHRYLLVFEEGVYSVKGKYFDFIVVENRADAQKYIGLSNNFRSLAPIT